MFPGLKEELESGALGNKVVPLAAAEALERTKAALDERIAQPEFYSEDRAAVRDTLARLQQTISDIDAAYARWTELESLAGR